MAIGYVSYRAPIRCDSVTVLTTIDPQLSGQGHSVLIVEAGPDGSWNPAVYNAEDRPYPAVYCNWNYPRYGDDGKKLNSTIDAGACIGGSTSSGLRETDINSLANCCSQWNGLV